LPRRPLSSGPRRPAVALPPTGDPGARLGHGQRPHHGAGEAIAGGGAERLRRCRRSGAGGQREYRVAVERRVRRPDGAGEPVLCHDRQTPAAAFVESRVGGDDGDRRIAADGVAAALRKIFRVERRIGDRRLRVEREGIRRRSAPGRVRSLPLPRAALHGNRILTENSGSVT